MRLLRIVSIVVFAFVLMTCEQNDLPPKKDSITVGPTIEIYQNGENYVAFCDAVFYSGKYYCAFREGENHAPYHEWHKNGYLKILSSIDLSKWVEEIEIKDDEWDLRDPCLCVANDQLHLYYGFYSFETPNPPHKTGHSLLKVSNSKISVVSSEKIDLGEYSNMWLWKVYYDGNQFYGTAYAEGSPLIYVTSKDGVHFNKESEIINAGDETSIVELPDKRKVAVIRSIEPKGKSDLAISEPPYNQWETYPLNEMIESPESFIYGGEVYVIGRSSYGMSMFKLDLEKKRANPVYNFFAFGGYGDCGYPGVILEDNQLTVVYYSVNPDTNITSIYQATLFFQ